MFAANQTGTYALTLRTIKSVEDEENRALAAETALGTRVDTEVTARITGDAGLSTRINNIVEAAPWADTGSILRAGNGINLTRDTDGNYIISAVAGSGNGGGTTPIRTHATYLGVRADEAFVPADYTGGVMSTTGTIRTPSYSGNRFLSFAYPATEPDLTSIEVQGDQLRQEYLDAGNARRFTKRANITINGIAHKVYTSITAFSPMTGSVRPTWILY